jgi:hypothetical protein
MESDHLVPCVFHAGVLGFIPILPFREVVGWPIYIDHCLMVIIREVRPGHAWFEEDL